MSEPIDGSEATEVSAGLQDIAALGAMALTIPLSAVAESAGEYAVVAIMFVGGFAFMMYRIRLMEKDDNE